MNMTHNNINQFLLPQFPQNNTEKLIDLISPDNTR